MTAQTITVIGARGGSGASTVAAALALSASRISPVALLSADVAAAAALLGLSVTPDSTGAAIDVTDALTLDSTAAGSARVAVVDAGGFDDLTGPPAGVSLVVLRGPCYLGLRSIVTSELQPDGIVLLAELGRSLTRRDVEDVSGVPVVAQIPVTPLVARSIDAGLFLNRAHTLRELRPLRTYVSSIVALPESRPGIATKARLHHPSNGSPQRPRTASPYSSPRPENHPSKIVTDLPGPLSGPGGRPPTRRNEVHGCAVGEAARARRRHSTYRCVSPEFVVACPP
jgi:hypothetical protein